MISDSGQPSPSGTGLRLLNDRTTLVIGALLIAITVFAWVSVVRQAREMAGMGMDMPSDTPALTDAVAFVVAWGVMMAAMMLPSALPMITLYGVTYRNRAPGQPRGIPTLLFALVYVTLWLAFGIPVYAASVLLRMVAQNNPMLASVAPYAVAATLAIAGVYQFTPLKYACLHVCRSPLGFLMGYWRAGVAGSLRMGAAHALYCIGCCWALMVVLVAAGAMGLPWVVLIATLVFIEKILPGGRWTARLIGTALLTLAVLVVLQPGLAGVLRGAAM